MRQTGHEWHSDSWLICASDLGSSANKLHPNRNVYAPRGGQ
jgi:hypothetical protein